MPWDTPFPLLCRPYACASHRMSLSSHYINHPCNTKMKMAVVLTFAHTISLWVYIFVGVITAFMVGLLSLIQPSEGQPWRAGWGATETPRITVPICSTNPGVQLQREHQNGLIFHLAVIKNINGIVHSLHGPPDRPMPRGKHKMKCSVERRSDPPQLESECWVV